MVNTWFTWKENKGIRNRMGGNETENDFVLVGKNTKSLKDIKVINLELQYKLVATDTEKRMLKEVEMNKYTIRWRV